MVNWDTDSKKIIAKIVRAKLLGDLNESNSATQLEWLRIITTPIEGVKWSEREEKQTYHYLQLHNEKFLVKFDVATDLYIVYKLQEGVEVTKEFMRITKTGICESIGKCIC